MTFDSLYLLGMMGDLNSSRSRNVFSDTLVDIDAGVQNKHYSLSTKREGKFFVPVDVELSCVDALCMDVKLLKYKSRVGERDYDRVRSEQSVRAKRELLHHIQPG